MGTNFFYNMVREYAEALVKQRPDCASSGAAMICAFLTNKHDVFAGITGISLNNGAVQSVPAEYLAVNALRSAGQTKVRQMITLSLADFSVVKPDSGGVAMMIESDSDNGKCEVFISQNESVKACELVGGIQPDVQKSVESKHEEFRTEEVKPTESETEKSKSEDFFEGFDSQETESSGNNAFEKMGLVSDSNAESSEETSELGAPADFSSGFDIDVTNPFYEAPAVDKEVATISSSSNNTLASTTTNSESKVPAMSKDDLLKQAKKKKKIAKNIFSAKRK
ncbi:MAG: hypothetical protein K2J47_06085 [Ruminococcus sp.]|nr:hypothetical protein [Ruminococcus sp.]